jgi:hypothetical protein
VVEEEVWKVRLLDGAPWHKEERVKEFFEKGFHHPSFPEVLQNSIRLRNVGGKVKGASSVPPILLPLKS